MGRPVIVLVPGFWEGPEVYEGVVNHLETHGYACFPLALRSTGHAASDPPNKNPSFYDDVEAIRQAMKGLVCLSKDIVMVTHSAGAFIGASAIEGYSHKERKAVGKLGGVSKMIFLAGGIWEEGTQLVPMPFMDFQGDKMYCKSPRELLFNDLPDEKVEGHLEGLQHQPARNWDEKILYCGWRHTENAYLISGRDQCIPSQMQPTIAQQVGSTLTDTVDAGHLAAVSQPDAVAKFVRKVAGEKVDQ